MIETFGKYHTLKVGLLRTKIINLKAQFVSKRYVGSHVITASKKLIIKSTYIIM